MSCDQLRKARLKREYTKGLNARGRRIIGGIIDAAESESTMPKKRKAFMKAFADYMSDCRARAIRDGKEVVFWYELLDSLKGDEDAAAERVRQMIGEMLRRLEPEKVVSIQ